MAKWVLTDAANGTHESEWSITDSDVAGAPSGFTVEQKTLSVGLSRGVDLLTVDNGRLRLSMLPTRGMGLWKGRLGELDLGWRSPVRGPVHPSYVPQAEPSGLGWLDGFDEWLCRCGLQSNGAPEFDDNGILVYPLHGHVANLPAHYVECVIDDGRVMIKGVVDECRFHFQKLRLTTTLTTRFDQPGFEIHDEVQNLSASDTELQMLYHCNFGTPLLEAGAELVLAAETVVPRNDWAADGIGHWSTYSEPKAAMPERVYFMKMYGDANDQTQALLRSANGQRGVSLSWNTKQLPCFSLWKNETALEDGYVTGLEPGTNFPNPRSFEKQQKRVVPLAAGARYEMDVEMTLHDTSAAVQEAVAAVAAVADGRPTRTVDKTLPNWCAP